MNDCNNISAVIECGNCGGYNAKENTCRVKAASAVQKYQVKKEVSPNAEKTNVFIDL
jgi:hypothetical protein